MQCWLTAFINLFLKKLGKSSATAICHIFIGGRLKRAYFLSGSQKEFPICADHQLSRHEPISPNYYTKNISHVIYKLASDSLKLIK